MFKYKWLLGALPLLTFAACSSDNSEAPVTSGEDSYAFIKVNLLSPGIDTRATTDNDFEIGSGDENAIDNVVMVFYGSQGNYLSSASMASGEITLADAPKPNGKNVELLKKATVKVSLSGGTIPSYMMVFANPVNASDVNWSLSAVKEQMRTTYAGSNGNFAMNNSVFFNDNQLQRAVAVSKNNFYQTDTEEISATAVDVYLERLAAKVKLHGATGSENNLGSQSNTLDSKTLKFVVEGWGLNATAKKCYLSKYFNTSEYSYSFFKGQFEGRNGKFSDWNEPEKSRSYWAISPDYTKPDNNVVGGKYNYPYVSDQAPVTNGVTKDNILNYYSFNDFAYGGSKHIDVGNSTYTLENTRHSSFYNGTDYKNSALISAVVVGHYTVGGEVTDFYVQGEHIYLSDEYLKTMAKSAAVIVKSDGTQLTDEDQLSNIFEIYHPTAPNVGDKTKGVAENRVTVRIKNSKTDGTYRPNYSALNGYGFKNGTKDPVQITEDNIDDINKAIYNNCGLASMYKDGKAFFNIPIRHLATAPGETEAWAPGSYGVVRNHAYDITVNGFANLTFETLGEGVRDPEDPIIPPTDPDNKYGIKANVKVLSWRLVTQAINLGE